MSLPNIVPNDEDRQLAEEMATGIEADQREGFIRGAAIALAKGRVIRYVKDTQLNYCDALMARCAKALAAAEYELAGGPVKDHVLACLTDLTAAGLDPETTSPLHAPRLRALLECVSRGLKPGAMPGSVRIGESFCEVSIHERTVSIELAYPRTEGNPNRVSIGLSDVRAADDLAVEYDFERDGWVLRMDKVREETTASGSCHMETIEGLAEVAFVPAWNEVES